MEFIGQLISKLGEREGEGRTGHWKTASFLLQTVEMYPKKIVVEVRDGAFRRIEEFEGLIGKNVRVEFDIDAHEYQGRWFNSVNAYRIYDMALEAAKAAEKAEKNQKTEQPPQDPFADLQNNNEGEMPY